MAIERALTRILMDVDAEVESATAHHGPMRGSHEAYGVILEEVDEFWDEVKLNPSKMTGDEQADLNKRMRKELIQVAAMAVRAIYDLGLTDAK